MIASRLPSGTRVVPKFFLLNPDGGFRKEIDSAHVVPVGVADDDVRDFFRLDTSEFDGFVRPNEILDGQFLEPAFAMEAAVQEDVVPAAANQPNDEHDVDLLVFGSAHHQIGNGKTR